MKCVVFLLLLGLAQDASAASLLPSMEGTPSAPYVPVQIYLGKLPEFHEKPKVYDLTGSGVPTEAKEILVYTYVTVKGESGPFLRGYYEFSTTDGANQYKKYMNVATGEDITVVNSDNLWLPMGADGELTAKLICVDCDNSATPVSEEFGDVFIIGYRD